MIMVCDKKKCTGCMACIESCPVGAIVYDDQIEYIQCVIDETRCIKCNKCRNVCQAVNRDIAYKKILACKEGYSNDSTIRAKSASGGATTEIVKTFLRNGGKVVTCKQMGVEFGYYLVESLEDFKDAQGSKYVKSNMRNVYEIIKNCISDEIDTLFIGLPCQVAGVKKVFKNSKSDKYLYTIDLICHGTPSIKVLHYWLKEKGGNLLPMEKISFRKGDVFSISGSNNICGSNYDKVLDSYILTFLKQLSYTSNCYCCQYARPERISDITLGDSWGSSLGKEESKKGVSLILIQSDKGKQLVRNINMSLYDTNYQTAIAHNQQLKRPSVKPLSRVLFFELLKNDMSYELATMFCMPYSFLKQKIKEFLYLIHIYKD